MKLIMIPFIVAFFCIFKQVRMNVMKNKLKVINEQQERLIEAQIKALNKLTFVLKWLMFKSILESLYDGMFYFRNQNLADDKLHCHSFIENGSW